MRNFNVVTYLVGLAGLAISVYVAGKAWTRSQEDNL
jgi:hypothetical protein